MCAVIGVIVHLSLTYAYSTYNTHRHIQRKEEKNPLNTHTHTETESQRFLSLFHLNIFIHSLFLTFSLSLYVLFLLLLLLLFVACFTFHSIRFSSPCTFNWYHCASGSRHQIWYSTIQSPGTCNGIGKQFKSYKYINIVYLYTTMETHSRKHILRHCTCQKHIILKAISSCMGEGESSFSRWWGRGCYFIILSLLCSNPEDNGCVSISLVYL